MKVAFFDRDGTIIRDYPDEEWKHVDEPEFIDGSIETLQILRNQGYEIIILTNQYLINEGMITSADYEMINDKMLRHLSDLGIDIKDVFFCPHRRDEGCNCIKPNRGMVDQALEKYPSIDLNKSIMVGDSTCDMELAIKCGMRGYWVNSTDSGWHPLITNLTHIKELLEYGGH